MFGSAVSPLPFLYPDTMQPLDSSMVLKAVNRTGYDSPEFLQRRGDAYVERCSGLVHRAQPRSDRHRHRHAACRYDNVCRPCMGAWVDLAAQMLARVDTLLPPHSPEDTQYLAPEKIPT